jgi:hypothetical protein
MYKNGPSIIELSRIHDIFLFRRCEAKPKQSSLWGGATGLLRFARNDGLRAMQYGNINKNLD